MKHQKASSQKTASLMYSVEELPPSCALGLTYNPSNSGGRNQEDHGSRPVLPMISSGTQNE
jgi:hypothetical protein